MTDQQPAASIPAGWYPDASQPGQNRWWDGTAWTASTQPTPAAQPAAQPAAYPTSQTGGAYSGAPAAMPYTLAPQQLSSADPMTPYIWIIALWPLLGVINLIAYGLLGGYNYDSLASGGTGAADIADTVLSLIAYLAMVGVVFLDHRELKARGLQPFPWGWGFLPIVYVIGRTVVIHRQTRRGLAPVFIFVGLFLAVRITALVIGVAIGISAVS